MSAFIYRGLNSNGEKVAGEIDAKNRHEAFQKLDRLKIQPLSLNAQSGGSTTGENPSAPGSPSGGGGALNLTRAHIITFTDELSSLLDAGLQLEPALAIMEKRVEKTNLKLVASSLRVMLRDGSSFSQALRRTSPSFGELYCSLVTAGEVSGALPQILKSQAHYLSAIQKLQNSVMTALIYPACLSTAGVALISIFMTILVPQLMSLFAKTGGRMPFATRMLIAASHFMASYWWLLLLIAGTIALGFWRLIQNPAGRRWWDRRQLEIPLFGPLLISNFYAQFSQTLATLLLNGVPLLSALRLINQTIANVYLRDRLTEVTGIVAEGGSLSRAMIRVGEFPSVLVDIITVGEQTGNLGSSLDKLAQRYDTELARRIQRITILIPIIIVLVMAVVVGVIAFSMIGGIFQSISGLKARH